MRNTLRWTSVAIVMVALGSCALAQNKTDSVADAARANRKVKPQTEKVVWTNENIANVDKEAIPETAAKAEADKADAPAVATEAGAEAKPAEAKAKKECDKTKDANCEKDEGASKADDYKAKLKQMQDDLADLQHEASLNEREWKLAQAAYYGDAGTQLRNQKKFADDQSGHAADQQKLQKAIEDQQKKIEDLKDQARKDGVNL